MKDLIPLLLSFLGFAALFAAVWILHRPLDVHSCPSRAVRNVHRALEWALTAWGVVVLVRIGMLFAPADRPVPADPGAGNVAPVPAAEPQL